MANFPSLSNTGGAQVMYGTQRSISYPCEIVRFTNGSEQRWVAQPPRADSMILNFTDLSAYDLAQIRAFYIANAGPLNYTWSITLDGTTYNNLCFEDDGFSPSLSQTAECWNLQLKVRQTL